MSKFSNIIRPANAIPRWPFSINRQSNQARSLIAWWPMSDWLGNTQADLSGSATPLTLNSTATVISSPYGSAVKGNGSSAYATGSPLCSGAKAILFTCWMYVADYGSLPMLWEYSSDALAQNGGFGCYWFSGELYVGTRQGGGQSQRKYAAPATGQWVHIAALYDYNVSTHEIDLFINGVLQTPTGEPANTDNSAFTFGSHALNLLVRDAASLHANAAMADVRVYGIAKTASEVWALYDPATRYELYQPLSRRVYGFAPTVSFTYKDASARIQALSGVKTSSSLVRSASASLNARSTVKSAISRAVAAHAEIIARSTVTAKGSRIAGASAKLNARSTVQSASSLIRGASVRIQSRASMQVRASAWRSIAAKLQARSGVLLGEIDVIDVAPGRIFKVHYEDRIFRVPAETRMFKVPRS